LNLTLYVNRSGSRPACAAQHAQGQQQGHCLRFDDPEHVVSSRRNPQ
jgi:hypothetical protein